ncbi:glycosyltransferase family 1 protein [Fischerella muscicola CCMEE 5323]|uniref:Glycosyltransferase family 1 protein n=2 Tax=Hapalosiphonaceae TaxID=1892263 RepID=A0A2N6K1K5_FISMU|nr:glycosyltransferase [Fischerella sp. FACHB-380]PLZ88377.1 glycosyltransferase family 1 protein [Fischerella muscicola CCMEE 5323]
MRVVTYTDSAGIGGAEISLGHLVTNVSNEIDVTVVGTCQLVVDKIAAKRPQAKRVILPATGVKSLTAHLQALHYLSPDILHINTCTPWECAMGLFTALTLPKARVVRVDQLPLRTTDVIKLWRTRMLSLRVDAHVAVGEASARQMEDFYALGRGTLISIPNCVPDNPCPSPVSPSRGKYLVIGCVGRLDAMKGHDLLIQAIAQLEGVQVVILGEGGQRTALKKLAGDLGVSDRISLPGWVDNPRNHLTQFDIFAMPSRSEGFPLAIVEAMLASLPVVATRVGSVAEAVIDGKTGFLVNKNDVEGLAVALRKLRDNPALRLRFGQCGREVALRQFTVDVMVKRYEQLWYKLLASPQRPRLLIPQPKE